MENFEEIAYWNNELIPANELKIPVTDMAVVHGVSITEMLRTFQGCPFSWDLHWERFLQSAELTGIPLPPGSIRSQIEQMVAHNCDGRPDNQCELGIILCASPGPNRTYYGNHLEPQPTFFAHTFPIAGELWAEATRHGQSLGISRVPQTPNASLPVAVKSRSRMSWYLADREVHQRYPGARAVVLDQYGFVRETSAANLFAVRDGVLLTPPEETVLPGVSRHITIQLAQQLGIPLAAQELTVDDLLQASEIMTTSTPYCLLGVSKLNSAAAGLQFPGPIMNILLEAWNHHVGLDIHEQLRQIAVRRLKA